MTRNFDNGNDGYKIVGSALLPQIYAVEKRWYLSNRCCCRYEQYKYCFSGWIQNIQ